MNTLEASRFTGIPAETLIRMRTRITSTLQSGPPFKRSLNEDGHSVFSYTKRDLQAWMKARNCLLTAGEAANIMGITRLEILDLSGSFNLGKGAGTLVIYPNKNIYLFKSPKMLRKIRTARAA